MQKGNPSLLHYPFLMSWKIMGTEDKIPAQVLILASKKNFRLAVERNRIKRLTREAYRLNKPYFYELLNNRRIIFSINYIAKEELEFAVINRKMSEGLQKITLELQRS
jgi:ribonuclease P protein component